MPITKGGLVPAKLINLNTGEEVNFMFNPNEYTLTKSNTWEAKPQKGKNIPAQEFKQGGVQSLKLQLRFDTYADGADVRLHTDMIWKMAAIDETQKDANSDKSRPPLVAFQWGKLYFTAVIKSISQKFTLFLPDGTPVRTTVDLTLDQAEDTTDFQPQPVASEPAATPQVVTSDSSQRIDHVAASQTGSASNQRAVAEASNVDNPKKVPNGTSLTVPKK